MKIKLNKRDEEITGIEQLSVKELLEYKNFTFKFLVVRVNGHAVKAGDYHSHMVRHGDDVVVLHLISGG